jgi:hypothetical protein
MDRPLLQGIDSIEIALALEPLQELDLAASLPAPEDCIADDTALVEMEQIVDDNTDVEALWADGADTVKQEYQDAPADGEQQGAFGDLPKGEQSRLIQRVLAEYVRR